MSLQLLPDNACGFGFSSLHERRARGGYVLGGNMEEEKTSLSESSREDW